MNIEEKEDLKKLLHAIQEEYKRDKKSDRLNDLLKALTKKEINNL